MTKGLIISLVVMAIAVVGGILTLGLPGAVLFGLGTPILWPTFGMNALDRLPADSLWPIAIVMAICWPVSIVAGYLIAFRLLRGAARAAQLGSFVGVLAGWNALLTLVCYILGRQAA